MVAIGSYVGRSYTCLCLCFVLQRRLTLDSFLCILAGEVRVVIPTRVQPLLVERHITLLDFCGVSLSIMHLFMKCGFDESFFDIPLG